MIPYKLPEKLSVDIHRYALGFDRAFNVFDEINSSIKNIQGYPPYNVKKLNDTELMIEIAVAGFTKEEIDITLQYGELTVNGVKKPEGKTDYLYRGIAAREFTRKFKLADTIVVKNANILDGVLYVLMENIIPEEHMPRKIEINTASSTFKKDVEFLVEKQNSKVLAESTAEKI